MALNHWETHINFSSKKTSHTSSWRFHRVSYFRMGQKFFPSTKRIIRQRIVSYERVKTYSFRLFQCSYQSYSCQVKRRQILTCSYICKSLRFVLFYGIYIINLFFFFPFIKKKKNFSISSMT